ncbi:MULTISPECIES: peptidylprolyl isomerase [Fusobacterium]|uniref:peptidylprolyl isomerase n=1 Tax=Fusobacterium TaxID=848 RepID=UPI001476D7AF|nr:MULTISPECIES: peptidylprolyl isomerase [Fusobacterium]NME35052.1 peptidylprolyl isomerase [Fusobacterium sp. FSA-380-WT-3A]
MKKIIKLLFVSMVLLALGACGSLSKRGNADLTKYNDIRATFVTTQGEVNFYLYPEAAPITVANFVNLALRGYYNNTVFHRAVENFIVQGGDPTGTGQGTPGYAIKDEFVNWLDFYQSGMLAMANMGPNTGGSQFFITLYPADFLNNKHTVFGEVVSQIDGETSRKLEKGDVIKEVKISGHYDLLLALNKEQVEEWNKILDKNYPNLKKYPIKDISEFEEEVARYQTELKEIYTPKEKVEKKEREFFIPKMIRAIEKKLKSDDVE